MSLIADDERRQRQQWAKAVAALSSQFATSNDDDHDGTSFSSAPCAVTLSWSSLSSSSTTTAAEESAAIVKNITSYLSLSDVMSGSSSSSSRRATAGPPNDPSERSHDGGDVTFRSWDDNVSALTFGSRKAVQQQQNLVILPPLHHYVDLELLHQEEKSQEQQSQDDVAASLFSLPQSLRSVCQQVNKVIKKARENGEKGNNQQQASTTSVNDFIRTLPQSVHENSANSLLVHSIASSSISHYGTAADEDPENVINEEGLFSMCNNLVRSLANINLVLLCKVMISVNAGSFAPSPPADDNDSSKAAPSTTTTETSTTCSS